jgi:hypothetical protein
MAETFALLILSLSKGCSLCSIPPKANRFILVNFDKIRVALKMIDPIGNSEPHTEVRFLCHDALDRKNILIPMG